MDNKAIAGILFETADLLEIDGADAFRVRSYRNAAEAIEAHPTQISEIISEPKKILEVRGLGKGMLLNLQDMFKEGRLGLHAELLKKYRPSMLELLRIQGLGPKTIALIWSAYQVSDLAGVEQLAREGKLRTLPRLGEKHELKILKAIEDYRRIAGRFLLDAAKVQADKIIAHINQFPDIDRITPAGSLRRGRDTVGDLDLLVTGDVCCSEEGRRSLTEHIVTLPGLMEVIARGDNKVSFRMRSGMQVDVRLLAKESFGAALQYFTGSKAHNVALRQRALKLGFTLNEYSLSRLDDSMAAAAATEEEVYAALKLDYIPPELRENTGEIEAAAQHALPRLIEQRDLRGDVHMHTVETDGRNTIEEMARAGVEQGYEYIAITDHSKNLAFANGLDDARALAHIAKIREVNARMPEITIYAGIEVDILADGSLDLSDEVLAQMDVVIASVHSHFNQTSAEMTQRLLKTIANPNTLLLGHPTGRLLLRRDAYPYDMEKIMRAAARHNVAMELNSYPDRLDLCDRHLRQAKQLGVKIVMNTDAHHVSHPPKISFGVSQARRGWLEKGDVLNTLPAAEFIATLNRRRPNYRFSESNAAQERAS